MDDRRKRASLYAGRVEDLWPDRHVGCECRKCGHLADVPVSIVQAKLSPNMQVQDIWRRFRCVKCGTLGVVAIHNLVQTLGWARDGK